MGLALTFMLGAATMGRLMLSLPGALVAAYYAMHVGWKPVVAAALGLLGGNLAALLFIPISPDVLFALPREPWVLLLQFAVAFYLVGVGFWLVYRRRHNRALAGPSTAVLAFVTALIAQLGNLDAQLTVVMFASLVGTSGADPSTAAITQAAKGLLVAFTIAETIALLVLPLMSKLLAAHIRRSRVGAYLGLAIVAAGVLIAIPHGLLDAAGPQTAAPTSNLQRAK